MQKKIGLLTKTWKIKNRVINDNSNPVYCGIPSNRAKRRSMIGSNIISIANNRGGKIPYKNNPIIKTFFLYSTK